MRLKFLFCTFILSLGLTTSPLKAQEHMDPKLLLAYCQLNPYDLILLLEDFNKFKKKNCASTEEFWGCTVDQKIFENILSQFIDIKRMVTCPNFSQIAQ